MAKAWVERSPEAKAVFAEADRVLGDSLGATLSELTFGASAATALNRTDVAQPAIYTASVACWRGLMARWGAGSLEEANLAATAGLSLGEYTALHIAGAFDFASGLRLVALRGKAMQDAAEAVPSGMVALIGADEAQANEVIRSAMQASTAGEVLVGANYNAPGQVVLSGHRTACERAAKAAEAVGFRATILGVAGAFHSPLMRPAAERLAAALGKTEISHPRATVVSNVTAKPHEESLESIRRSLVEQLTKPVRWAESCTWLASGVWGSGTLTTAQASSGGGAEYHELSPGRTLAGLMRRISKAVKVHTHDTPDE